MKNLINEVATALEILGVQGEVEVEPIVGFDRLKVSVDGEYFGIWDTTRKTFVD